MNRNRTLNVIRNTRICDIQSIELAGQPQIFDPEKVERLANLLLESGNLATPLLLRRKNALSYTLVAGELEYQAALRAREIEPSFKDVAAYVLDGDIEQNMLQQRQINSFGRSDHSPIAAAIIPAEVNNLSGGHLAAQRATYTVAAPNARDLASKPLAEHTTVHQTTVTKVDLSEVLDAIEELKTYLDEDLSSQLANHLGAQLTSLVENLIEPMLASAMSTPVATPHPQPDAPTLATPLSATGQSADAPRASSAQSHSPQAIGKNSLAPKPPTAPATISKATVHKPSVQLLSTGLEAEIVAYFNTQPITKIFLQSLTVGEKASRKIQAAVPEQRQAKPFTDGTDLQQRIPEIGPVIWEKIQQHWHDVVPPSLSVTVNQEVVSKESVTSPSKNPQLVAEAYPTATILNADPDETDDEDLAETVTETITEILTESIIEPEPPQITVEIPAESVVEDIPPHLQRFNHRLTTGEGLYQILIELKNIGFTHKIAQKFIDDSRPHAPFASFAELQRVAGLNATNWRYLVAAWSLS